MRGNFARESMRALMQEMKEASQRARCEADAMHLIEYESTGHALSLFAILKEGIDESIDEIALVRLRLISTLSQVHATELVGDISYVSGSLLSIKLSKTIRTHATPFLSGAIASLLQACVQQFREGWEVVIQRHFLSRLASLISKTDNEDVGHYFDVFLALSVNVPPSKACMGAFTDILAASLSLSSHYLQNDVSEPTVLRFLSMLQVLIEYLGGSTPLHHLEESLRVTTFILGDPRERVRIFTLQTLFIMGLVASEDPNLQDCYQSAVTPLHQILKVMVTRDSRPEVKELAQDCLGTLMAQFTPDKMHMPPVSASASASTSRSPFSSATSRLEAGREAPVQDEKFSHHSQLRVPLYPRRYWSSTPARVPPPEARHKRKSADPAVEIFISRGGAPKLYVPVEDDMADISVIASTDDRRMQEPPSALPLPQAHRSEGRALSPGETPSNPGMQSIRLRADAHNDSSLLPLAKSSLTKFGSIQAGNVEEEREQEHEQEEEGEKEEKEEEHASQQEEKQQQQQQQQQQHVQKSSPEEMTASPAWEEDALRRSVYEAKEAGTESLESLLSRLATLHSKKLEERFQARKVGKLHKLQQAHAHAIASLNARLQADMARVERETSQDLDKALHVFRTVRLPEIQTLLAEDK